MRRKTALPGVFVAALLLLPSTSVAGAGVWIDDEQTQLRLVYDRAENSGELMLGLHMRLENGWKTYWRHPGEAGAPPHFDWSKNDNLQVSEILWPAPKRFAAFGFDSYGYEREMLLPIRVKHLDSTKPATVHLSLNYLICSNICIPKSTKLSLSLNASDGAGAEADLIRHYLDRVPMTGRDNPYEISDVRLIENGGKPMLSLKVRSESGFNTPDMFIESKDNFSFGRPQVEYDKTPGVARFQLPVYDDLDKGRSLAGKNLRLTVADGSLSGEQTIALRGN